MHLTHSPGRTRQHLGYLKVLVSLRTGTLEHQRGPTEQVGTSGPATIAIAQHRITIADQQDGYVMAVNHLCFSSANKKWIKKFNASPAGDH